MIKIPDTEDSSGMTGPPLVFEARALDLSRLPRIDSHLHTSWTDGKATVAETYQRAVELGLEVILYSEHSRKTSTDWFSRFAEEVRSLPAAPCRAYVGTEVKIESLDGEIDTIPAISDLCDFIMASVHRFPDGRGGAIPFGEVNPDEAVDREFALSWAALENPKIDILGHMFGMSYRRYKVTPPDEKIRALIARAAEYGVAVEVNSHYHPNPFQYIEWCREYDARITFGSNAHSLEKIGEIMRQLGAERAR
ncbi:PHP domain-containing protein [Sulfuricaulis limicola]|nr:PHP domain-containing protein [Sulfuricaulis limicola]